MEHRNDDTRRRPARCVSLLALTAMVALGANCGNRNSTAEIRQAAGIPAAATSEPFESAAPPPASETTATSAPTDTAAAASTTPAAPADGAGTPASQSAPKAASVPSQSRSGLPAGGSSPKAAAGSSPGSRGGAAASRSATPASGATAPAGSPTPVVPAGCTGAKAPLVIGTVGTQSGVAGNALFPGVKAAQAWVAAQNERGGLDCHPIRYVVADDGADPARHQSLVKQLVEQEKIIGIVYMDALFSGYSSVDYLKSRQIPVFGQEGGSTFFKGSPVHFVSGASGADLMDLTATVAGPVLKAQNKTKVALLTCQEASVCNLANDRWTASAGRAGYTVVYSGKGTLTQPDYTSHCLAAQNAGAQAMFVALDPNSEKRVASSCSQVGFKPIYVTQIMNSRADFKDDPNFDGMIIAENNLPWFMTESPAIAEYQSVLKKFAPGTNPDPSSLAGWAAAKLFERAARGNLSDPPTSADLFRGAGTIKNDTLNGLSPPLTLIPGQPQADIPCGWTVVIKDGKFTSDGKLVCK